MLGLHLIASDKPLEKCRGEGSCRVCNIRRINMVQLVGSDDPRGTIPLCAHCEDQWRRHELNVGHRLTRKEAGFIVGALGFMEAHRFLMPLEYHRRLEQARSEIEEAA